jgi:LmbE family N-acetylglucosaminyl deacetylase
MRFLLFLLLLPLLTRSQSTRQASSAEIKAKLKKLNFLGSVLYVAAHPDDENTRVITYFAIDRLAATAYLSMTRGDGGQNLIGPEIRDELGLIRTQELLAARRIDGGQQFFTRANDFGFSKSADETFRIWGKDEILGDVIRVFRQYQPDVIITRFPPDERAGHGHHTASAMLAQEAFDLAAQPQPYADQLQELTPWQVKRLYTNTGRWWNQTINENTPGIITLNVGGYSALLGTSYTEIAAVSRSQHKSQGFGSRGTRGDQLEFLEHVKGEKAEKDVFEGVNTSWTRVEGGEKVKPLVEKAILEFNEEKPESLLPLLLEIRTQVLALEMGIWQQRKLMEVEELIRWCAGMFVEASADHYYAVPDKNLTVTLEAVNRTGADVRIEKMTANGLPYDTTLATPLRFNKPLQIKIKRLVNNSHVYSAPYWLQQPHSLGTFTVTDKSLIGKPEASASLHLNVTLAVNGTPLSVTVPVVYKSVDPVKGELTRPVETVPPVFVNISEPVIIFNTEAPKEVKLVLKAAAQGKVSGVLKLQLPEGWKSQPEQIEFELSRLGEELSKTFQISPSKAEGRFTLHAVAEMGGKAYGWSAKTIAYDHIPTQTLLPPAETELVRINLKKEGSTVAYIKGAGDDVPTALRNMGYSVWEMKNEEITPENLKRVDAVVLGIRALNTNDRLRFVMSDLLKYVADGGTMIVQYNTNFDLETDVYAPYPLTISRDRVTEEDAEVRILKPDHPLLNYPNKISNADFEGWVQERGLYFPNKWSEPFEALLSMNDKREPAKEGSLLVAKHGEGYYVYTGLSFFRELPEGVPGAYKLFANLVSAGKPKKLISTKSKIRSR